MSTFKTTFYLIVVLVFTLVVMLVDNTMVKGAPCRSGTDVPCESMDCMVERYAR